MVGSGSQQHYLPGANKLSMMGNLKHRLLFANICEKQLSSGEPVPLLVLVMASPPATQQHKPLQWPYMSIMASQITGNWTVCSTASSGKHISSSLALLGRESTIHRWISLTVPGMWKTLPCHVIILQCPADGWIFPTSPRVHDGLVVGLRPALEGFVVTMHEGACETGSQIPTA